MSVSPTATLRGMVTASTSCGTLTKEGCAVNAQSMRGRGVSGEVEVEVEEVLVGICEECRLMR